LTWAIDTTKLYLCHGIMTSTSCCAKSLGPAKAIVNVKAEVAGVATETMLPPAIQEFGNVGVTLEERSAGALEAA
jgi:hypothetical protein